MIDSIKMTQFCDSARNVVQPPPIQDPDRERVVNPGRPDDDEPVLPPEEPKPAVPPAPIRGR